MNKTFSQERVGRKENTRKGGLEGGEGEREGESKSKGAEIWREVKVVRRNAVTTWVGAATVCTGE